MLLILLCFILCVCHVYWKGALKVQIQKGISMQAYVQDSNIFQSTKYKLAVFKPRLFYQDWVVSFASAKLFSEIWLESL